MHSAKAVMQMIRQIAEWWSYKTSPKVNARVLRGVPMDGDCNIASMIIMRLKGLQFTFTRNRDAQQQSIYLEIPDIYTHHADVHGSFRFGAYGRSLKRSYSNVCQCAAWLTLCRLQRPWPVQTSVFRLTCRGWDKGSTTMSVRS